MGKFNQNADVAADLGVKLSKGIPVAIFFNPDGQVIGTTNEGQLEPARRYSSKQILKFIKDIAERSRILALCTVDCEPFIQARENQRQTAGTFLKSKLIFPASTRPETVNKDSSG